jgi:hypothetical protein
MSFSQSNAVMVLPNGNATISPADSGKLFTVVQSAGQTFTLPVLQSGLFYTFILKTPGNFTTVINAASNTPIIGHAISGPTATPIITVGAGTGSVRFSTTCVAGDRINLVCDGTNWWADCVSASNTAATAITFV